MKILKLIKQKHGNYFVVVDEIPEITYEKIGDSYVGSATSSNGDIIASRFLERRYYDSAFGGAEIELKMKDGSLKKIKDYWFDNGSYAEHGEFVNIGVGTVDELQKCYVYSGYNINKEFFEKMVNEYLTREKLYEYREVEEWCNLQYIWYDVIVNGTQIPYMMNKFGDMVEKESKIRVYPRRNIIWRINGTFKTYVFFRFSYKNNGKLVKIDANYLDTLKSTLPFTEEEIKINCKIPTFSA